MGVETNRCGTAAGSQAAVGICFTEGSALGGLTKNVKKPRARVRAYCHKGPVVCNHDHPNKPPHVLHSLAVILLTNPHQLKCQPQKVPQI